MTAITVATAEDLAVREAKNLPDLIDRLQLVNPPLAAAFSGKALVASRTPWGTILLPAITWIAAYYGLGWPPEVDTLIAGLLVLVCSFAMRAITSSPITGWLHRRPVVVVTTPAFADAGGLPIPPPPLPQSVALKP